MLTKFTSTMKNLPVLFLCSLLLLLAVTANEEDGAHLLELHGSGTTNPSKCYWHAMERIVEGSRTPLHLTYRAVGTGTGQAEFLAGPNVTYFGSGDVPLSTEDFEQVQVDGGMVHFPVLLGAVSWFHSVLPGLEEETSLQLTPCLLARIFSGDITSWTHPDIVAHNPTLPAVLSSGSTDIRVAHRVHGSSSTASMTEYLNAACEEHWPDTWVTKEFKDGWPTVDGATNADLIGCEGSAGVTECILQQDDHANTHKVTIGYLDAGHGHSSGLPEVAVQNEEGNFVTSKEANANGGIQQAVLEALRSGVLPSNFDDDFGHVSLVNQPGESTWPVVLLTYIYVRKNLSFIDEPAERSLLKAFLAYIYREEFIEPCVEEFGFVRLPETYRRQAEGAIDDLLEDGADEAIEWTFENETQKVTGAGPFVISTKRRSFGQVERSALQQDVGGLEEQMLMLQQQVESLQAELQDSANAQDTKVNAALIMSSIALFFCILFALHLCVMKYSKGRGSKNVVHEDANGGTGSSNSDGEDGKLTASGGSSGSGKPENVV